MDKYVEKITEHLDGDMDYLDQLDTIQTDEEHEMIMKEIREMDQIVRENKELDNRHDEAVQRIKAERNQAIVGHIAGSLKVIVAIGLGSLALVRDEEHVFSKQLSNIGNMLAKFL